MSIKSRFKSVSDLKVVRIRQKFDTQCLADVRNAVRRELNDLEPLVRAGNHVAIAVGSRGITDIREIVAETVSFFRRAETLPFIVPAMGSHGGATAEGQAEILAGYGIDERSVGAPIMSTMDVVPVSGPDTPAIYIDKYAATADLIFLINRIKPHTDFHGDYESGLVKMCVIGLGKRRLALEMHRYGVRGLKQRIPEIAGRVLSTKKIIGGLAVVENAYDRTLVVKALAADRIMQEEPSLLALAKRHMPSLPVDFADILIVDQIGKDISGVGMDTNIIGRLYISGEPEPETPRIESIVIADLTEKSHGNALGMGLADVMTRRLYEKIDFRVTYENAYTSGFLQRAKQPVIVRDGVEALEFALRSCGGVMPLDTRILRIRDTSSLAELFVSPVLLSEMAGDIEILEEDVDLFTENKDFNPF